MSRPNHFENFLISMWQELGENIRNFNQDLIATLWKEYSTKSYSTKGFIKKIKLAYDFYVKTMNFEDEIFKAKYANEVNFKDESKSDEEREKGNEYFRNHCLICSIESYTKSLAYAPVDSIQTAKAYGNRSAALIEAGMFQECIEDINRAFDSGYPKADSYKLLMRKATCYYWLAEVSAMNLVIKEMLEISDKMKRKEIIKAIKNRKASSFVDVFYPDPPPLAFGANNEIPNVSSAVTLNYNEKYGRHLIANRDIDIGAVLVAEKAYCHIPTDKHKYDHCGTCCRLCFTLIPCDLCYTVMFCSITCKKIAYETFHKAECAVLCRLEKYEKYAKIFLDSIYGFAVRIISTVGLQNLQQYMDKIDNEKMPVTNEEKRTQGFTGNIFDSSNFDSVFNLDHRIDDDKHEVDRLFLRCVGSVLVTKCFNISPEDKNYFKFAGLCLRLVSCFAYYRNRTGELYVYWGKYFSMDESYTVHAIYPASRFVIHSCDPNTLNYQYGDFNIIQCVKPIKAGSLVSGTCVAPLNRTVEERRKILMENFLIDCKCDLCVKKIEIYLSTPTKIKNDFDVLYGEILSLSHLDIEKEFVPIFKFHKEAYDSRLKELIQNRINYLKRFLNDFPYDSLIIKVQAALFSLFRMHGNLILFVNPCQHKSQHS